MNISLFCAKLGIDTLVRILLKAGLVPKDTPAASGKFRLKLVYRIMHLHNIDDALESLYRGGKETLNTCICRETRVANSTFWFFIFISIFFFLFGCNTTTTTRHSVDKNHSTILLAVLFVNESSERWKERERSMVLYFSLQLFFTAMKNCNPSCG